MSIFDAIAQLPEVVEHIQTWTLTEWCAAGWTAFSCLVVYANRG